MSRIKLIHVITVALAIVLMLLPWGAVVRSLSAAESGAQYESLKNFSYFNPILFKYHHFAPILCAIESALLLLLLVFSYFTDENKVISYVILSMSCVAVILSLLPLQLGFKFFNMTALGISYLLICSVILSIHRLTGKLFVEEAEEEPTE